MNLVRFASGAVKRAYNTYWAMWHENCLFSNNKETLLRAPYEGEYGEKADQTNSPIGLGARPGDDRIRLRSRAAGYRCRCDSQDARDRQDHPDGAEYGGPLCH